VKSLSWDNVESEIRTLRMPSRYEEPFACHIGIALWQEYLTRNPGGRKVPPGDLMDCTDPDMAAGMCLGRVQH
jgi:hypothetical protein